MKYREDNRTPGGLRNVPRGPQVLLTKLVVFAREKVPGFNTNVCFLSSTLFLFLWSEHLSKAEKTRKRIKNEFKQCPKVVFTEDGIRNPSRSIIGSLGTILDRSDLKVRFMWVPVDRREERRSLCVGQSPEHRNGAPTPATVGGMEAVGGNRREQLLVTRLGLGLHPRLNAGQVNVNVESRWRVSNTSLGITTGLKGKIRDKLKGREITDDKI